MKKRDLIFFGLIFIAFMFLRIPVLHQPYHQDEYKWVQYSHPEITPPGTVPHPPLTEFIYTKIGPLVGDDNFRTIPLFFGIIDFFLLFYLAKIIFDKRTAFFVISLFTLSFYSLLANLMVDVDGSIMPFFFLLLSIGYIKYKQSEWRDKKWLILIILGAVGGFLIKVSSVLPIVAFGLDFAIENKAFSDKRRVYKYLLSAVGVGIFLVALLFIAKFIFPFFNLEYSFKYWEHFWNSSSILNRGWLQTFIQLVKSILYTSPVLLFPLLFIDREIWKKIKPFFVFIISGLIFYLLIFDFSIGALDRYFQFWIIPLCLISGAVYKKYFENFHIDKNYVISFSVLSILIIALQFINHYVPPLYPKTEYLNRILTLKWNFLYPFSGGSGPLPFYISFLFMALIWLLTFVFAVYSKNNHSRVGMLLGILILGILYNGVFIEEYLFGKINGNASSLVKDSAIFIKNNPDIKKVTVYNDNGGYNIMQTGKYRRRLYIDPKFDINVKITTLNQYKEYYLVVDIPHIDPNTVYAKYFNSCSVIFNEFSGVISSKIYDCTKAPDLKM